LLFRSPRFFPGVVFFLFYLFSVKPTSSTDGNTFFKNVIPRARFLNCRDIPLTGDFPSFFQTGTLTPGFYLLFYQKWLSPATFWCSSCFFSNLTESHRFPDGRHTRIFRLSFRTSNELTIPFVIQYPPRGNGSCLMAVVVS